MISGAAVAVIGLLTVAVILSGTPRTAGKPRPGLASHNSGAPPSVQWVYGTGGVVNSTLAVASGTAYIGSDNGKAYALDAATGHVHWVYKTGGAFGSSPAVANGTVYVGNSNGKVYALDAVSGHLRWVYKTGKNAPVSSSPAVANGTVYVGSDNGKVYALDAATGHLQWAYATGSSVSSSPAVANGTVYVGSDNGKVYALDAATGHLRWAYSNALMSGSGFSPMPAGGIVYIGDYTRVLGIEATTGRLLWRHNWNANSFSQSSSGMFSTAPSRSEEAQLQKIKDPRERALKQFQFYMQHQAKVVQAISNTFNTRHQANLNQISNMNTRHQSALNQMSNIKTRPTQPTRFRPTVAGRTVYIGCSYTSVCALTTAS
jgi:outer membrane protein assembly factor BamB